MYPRKPSRFCGAVAGAIVAVAAATGAYAQGKPNVLVIWGDDIGQFNVSAYNQG
jgi:arylsulfatase